MHAFSRSVTTCRVKAKGKASILRFRVHQIQINHEVRFLTASCPAAIEKQTNKHAQGAFCLRYIWRNNIERNNRVTCPCVGVRQSSSSAQLASPFPLPSTLGRLCRCLPTNVSHLSPPSSSLALRCRTSFSAACLNIVPGGA